MKIVNYYYMATSVYTDPFSAIYNNKKMSTPAPNMSTPSGPVYAPPPVTKPTTPVVKSYTAPATPPPTPSQPETGGVLRPGETVEQRNARLGFGPKPVPETPTSPTPITPTTPAPTTTPTPTTSTSTPSTSQSILDQYKQMYGADVPTAPTTSQAPDYLAQYGLTPDSIDKQLEKAKLAIKQKYDVLREQTERDTENERQQNISQLYSVGEVNPLSSGVGSIGTASQDVLNRRKDQLSALESAEIAQAEAAARGEKYAGVEIARQKQMDEEARIQQEYTNSRQKLLDAVSLVQAGRTMSQEDKTNAIQSMKDLIALGGAQAFEGYTTDDYSALDKAAGYRTGTMENLIKKIKIDELKGESNIQTLDDGSVVNLKQKKDGTWDIETLIKAPASSTKAPDTGKFGDLTYQWNADTNSWELPAGVQQGDSSTAPGVGATSDALMQAQQKVNAIDSIINDPNFDKVFGLVSQQTSRFSPSAQQLKNTVNQFINDLVLDERGRLKGSGAISDFESKIIRQAATKLGTNLNEEQAKAVLNELKQKFENVGSSSYLSRALGITQDDAALRLENMYAESGVYPTLEDLQQTFPTGFNSPLSMGGNGSLTKAAMISYPEGSKEGQCGYFAHKLVNFPPIGDGKNEKIKSVEKFGIPSPVWKQNPQVGDVIITNENPTYGHVAVVLEIKPNGDLVLAESNFKQKDKVSYGRTLNVNSPKIYGAIRGTVKV